MEVTVDQISTILSEPKLNLNCFSNVSDRINYPQS